MIYDVSIKNNGGDYLLSIAALIQPVLVLAQLFAIDVMKMDPSLANRYRILFTAVPIIIAMFIAVRRKFLLTAITYFLAILIVVITLSRYPERWPVMKDDLLKFTLSVVIPTGLCIASVRNIVVLMRSMLFVSISAAFIGVLYAIMYLSGSFSIEDYSIAFSYALMLPTFYLITKKNKLWTIVAIVMMIEMMAIGSRGAFILSLVYLLYTLFWGKIPLPRMLIYLFLIIVIYLLFYESFLDLLSNLFRSIGIRSRTLNLIRSEELIAYDAGRSVITQNTMQLINQRPLFGYGVWVDRQYFGTYCHNVFLELILDYGFIGFFLIMIVFAYKQIKIFFKIPSGHKTLYIMMLSLLIPLLVSSSYLTSFNVGMFLGFSYLLSEMNQKRVFQEYQLE